MGVSGIRNDFTFMCMVSRACQSSINSKAFGFVGVVSILDIVSTEQVFLTNALGEVPLSKSVSDVSNVLFCHVFL